MKLDRLRELRKAKKKTITELAPIVGVTRETYTKMENGQTNPRFGLVMKILNELGYTLLLIDQKEISSLNECEVKPTNFCHTPSD